MEQKKRLNTFTVKHEDKEMQVFIPDTGDKAENAYLELAEREKTLDQLKKKPHREKSPLSPEEQAGAIKDYKRFATRRKSNNVPRYFSANYSS